MYVILYICNINYIYICNIKYIYICNIIYIWWFIKIPLSANDHSSQIKMLLSRNFRELHVYLSRSPCWATTPLMKIRSSPAKLRQRITDHFLIAFFNVQLASRNPFSDRLLLTIFFCKVYWPTPFNMHFDFRPLLRRTFAELSRKYPYSQTLAISRGRIEGKANTRGLGVCLSQSLTLGNLAAAFGACFFRLQKSHWAVTAAGARMCFRTMVFGCREACKVIVQKHHHTGNWTRTKPKFSGDLLLPDPRRQWVAALYTMIIISNFRETFAKKNVTFANSEKTFARVSRTFRSITIYVCDTLYKYIYICMCMLDIKTMI